MIKYCIIALFCILGHFGLQAQHTVHLTESWVQVGTKCAGCGSAHFKIHRVPYPDKNGVYWAHVQVWSNSFNEYGSLVATYVDVPRVFAMDGYGNKMRPALITQEYFLAKPKSQYFDGINNMFYLYSQNPGQQYILEFSDLENY